MAKGIPSAHVVRKDTSPEELAQGIIKGLLIINDQLEEIGEKMEDKVIFAFRAGYATGLMSMGFNQEMMESVDKAFDEAMDELQKKFNS